MPFVSIIVVVRNGERYLRDALNSIQLQSYRDREIIVVDGQSTDGTARIARSFPGVYYLCQTTLGLANARNLGIEAARGRYIAFLDHDDQWHPDKLARQVALHDANPSILYSLTQMIFRREPGAAVPYGMTAESLTQPRAAGTPSALIARADLFNRIGGFDSRFAIACDADWFTRARDEQIPTAIIPEVLVYKRLHEDNLSRNIALNRREMFQVARQSIMRQR
jgi:glycosyltransferase involved in cell wall biosynthesis